MENNKFIETEETKEHQKYLKSITIKPMDWLNQELKKKEESNDDRGDNRTTI